MELFKVTSGVRVQHSQDDVVSMLKRNWKQAKSELTCQELVEFKLEEEADLTSCFVVTFLLKLHLQVSHFDWPYCSGAYQ
jgi:hypothetical protein